MDGLVCAEPKYMYTFEQLKTSFMFAEVRLQIENNSGENLKIIWTNRHFRIVSCLLCQLKMCRHSFSICWHHLAMLYVKIMFEFGQRSVLFSIPLKI